jgi:hypothetical protein
MTNCFVLIHAFSCFFMTGLIWVIQVLHYPSFHFIGKEFAKEFNRFHVFRITLIVAPIMTVELITAILLVKSLDSTLLYLNLILLLITWLTTALVSMPLHFKLINKTKNKYIRSLIITNWPRTILWTLRSYLVSVYIYRSLYAG